MWTELLFRWAVWPIPIHHLPEPLSYYVIFITFFSVLADYLSGASWTGPIIMALVGSNRQTLPSDPKWGDWKYYWTDAPRSYAQDLGCPASALCFSVALVVRTKTWEPPGRSLVSCWEPPMDHGKIICSKETSGNVDSHTSRRYMATLQKDRWSCGGWAWVVQLCI